METKWDLFKTGFGSHIKYGLLGKKIPPNFFVRSWVRSSDVLWFYLSVCVWTADWNKLNKCNIRLEEVKHHVHLQSSCAVKTKETAGLDFLSMRLCYICTRDICDLLERENLWSGNFGWADKVEWSLRTVWEHPLLRSPQCLSITSKSKTSSAPSPAF